jgi:hypothetical protein
MVLQPIAVVNNIPQRLLVQSRLYKNTLKAKA